ncbi:MAG: hypothetical protein IJ759_05455 [Bacteroidales bacterium]|nr:hypothetical protein [Bacteroidales bacterium]
MKKKSFLIGLCAFIIVPLCLVSCRKFDENKFFEDAKKYYLNSFKGFPTDTITNYDGTIDTVYITTNIDSFMQNNCNFLIAENDVKSYAKNMEYNIHSKIKSWKIDYYTKGKETTDTNELWQTYYYLFDNNQHCYYDYHYINTKEVKGKWHTFRRYNICGKRTKEQYSFFEEDGKYYASNGTKIIQYDKQGRRMADILLKENDTLIYYGNIYQYPDKNTVYKIEYNKLYGYKSGELGYIYLKRYDNKGNIIRDSSDFYDATFTYDSQNRITQDKRKHDSYIFITEYTYKGDKLISKKSYDNGKLIRSNDITYKDGKSITNGYDEASGKCTITQEYDKHGNCIRKTKTYPNGYICTENHTIEYYD